jgi:hypothetical protein
MKLRYSTTYEKAIELKNENLITVIKEIPDKVCAAILAQCQINGAVPISQQQVETMILGVQNRLLDAINNNNAVHQNQNITNTTIPAQVNLDHHSWTWGSRIHPVPRGFKFPRCDTKKLFDLWYEGTLIVEGDNSYKTLPLRKLKEV